MAKKKTGLVRESCESDPSCQVTDGGFDWQLVLFCHPVGSGRVKTPAAGHSSESAGNLDFIYYTDNAALATGYRRPALYQGTCVSDISYSIDTAFHVN